LAAPSSNGSEVVTFQNVSKRYGDVVAVTNLDLAVVEGEFLSLLGPSGCGKTTTLRMIAGFEQPTTGIVTLAGHPVNGVPAFRRPANMVFQHYALFPHLNVAQNVAYGLKQVKPKQRKKAIAQRVAQTLELVRLEGFENRRIWELSGGQQQRIALARALINKPKVLLLDEPLAALDRKLRHTMQIELQTLQRNVEITFILVTHDQEEALSMSDRVCIMRSGEIVQTGTPRMLYDKPLNRYVADFVGRSNFFPGQVSAKNGETIEVVLDSGVTIHSNNPNNEPTLRVNHSVFVSVRPEQLRMSRTESQLPENQAFHTTGQVLNRIFLGEHTEYLLRNETIGDFLLLAPRQSELAEPPLETGEIVYATCSRESALVLNAD